MEKASVIKRASGCTVGLLSICRSYYNVLQKEWDRTTAPDVGSSPHGWYQVTNT